MAVRDKESLAPAAPFAKYAAWKSLRAIVCAPAVGRGQQSGGSPWTLDVEESFCSKTTRAVSDCPEPGTRKN
jgi:hypothetical protein